MGKRSIGSFFFFIGTLLLNAPLAAENVKITGQVNSASITANIVVSNIAATTVPTPNDQNSLFALLKIALPSTSNGGQTQSDSNPVLNDPNQATTGLNRNFYWDSNKTATATTDPNSGLVTITYAITLVPNTGITPPGSIAGVTDQNTKQVTVSVSFNSGTAQLQALAVLFSKPAALTTCSLPVGINLGILLACPTTVSAVANTQSTTQAVSNYTMFVVDPDFSDTATLDAKIVDNTAGIDTATTCTVDMSTDTPDCVTCTGTGDIYLLTAQSNALVQSKLFPIRTGLQALNGLNPDKTYTVIYQYENSTKRACKQVTPIETYLVSDLENPDNPPEFGDPRCFVVSATHGKNSSIADTYRWGRDRFLMPFATGRALMDWYYKTSESFATYLTTAPVLRNVLYGALLLPAGGILMLKSVMGLSQVELSILLLIMGAMGWVCLKQKKRR